MPSSFSEEHSQTKDSSTFLTCQLATPPSFIRMECPTYGGDRKRYTWYLHANVMTAGPSTAVVLITGIEAGSKKVLQYIRSDNSFVRICKSQIASHLMYSWRVGVTKSTVPPPGTTGTLLRKSFSLQMSRPGVPTPPRNLCPETNTASLATSA